ncbi:MAG: PEGA domain-containing protein [Terriglobia bacterium]
MSWLCPDCGRELPLWQAQCPHCAVTTRPDAPATPEPESTQVGHSVPEPNPQPETPPEAREPASAAAAFPVRSGVPKVAYLVVAAVLVALTVFLWPTDQVALHIETQPEGAVVFLDGDRAGETPLDLGGLTDGYRYTLRVEREGYQPFEQNFVAQAQADPWRIELKPGPDPALNEAVVAELIGQIGESGRTQVFSDELAQALFTVNPLIEQNPWLTEQTWAQIFQEVINKNFGGDSQEFLRHLRTYRQELAKGTTSKQAWYQHLEKCERVCRPVVMEVFRRHLEWLRRSGFDMVYFPINQYELTEEDRATIREFVHIHNLAKDPSRQVLLVGRASRIGGQQYNLELSRRRVDSVLAELAAQLPDGRARVRTAYLGFEPPQISPAVAQFLHLDTSLSKQQLNQSVMLIVSEPLPASRHTPA